MMMMHQKPTVDIPPWLDDPTAYSLHHHYFNDLLDAAAAADEDAADLDVDFPDYAIDAYSCDEFRMYEFKIRRCTRGRSHDWTECPYAHPGEKARRRDPRKHHYSGTACPDFRRGNCKRGENCDMAHGVFECWLHPARYRTQPCKDGTACRRRVCFFAHTPEQLRVLPQSPKTPLESYDGSPMRRKMAVATTAGGMGFSPPLSPTGGAEEEEAVLAAAMRKLQLGRVRSGLGFLSVPTTPTKVALGFEEEEEGKVERVESGRELRAKMYERLSKESGVAVGRNGRGSGPDVGWVSELVK